VVARLSSRIDLRSLASLLLQVVSVVVPSLALGAAIAYIAH